MTCLIFDLDGTLVDSERLSGQVFKSLLPDLGGSIEEITRWCTGRKLADLVAEMRNELEITIPDDFIALFRKELAQVFEHSLLPIDGAQDMLEQLSLPMCIASNGPLTKMQQSTRICGLQPYFGNRLFSAYEVGNWKPSPGLFLHAANEMGVDPGKCIVVEDSETVLHAADAAGMTVIHFSSQDVSTQPHHISHLSELPALINNLTQ